MVRYDVYKSLSSSPHGFPPLDLGFLVYVTGEEKKKN